MKNYRVLLILFMAGLFMYSCMEEENYIPPTEETSFEIDNRDDFECTPTGEECVEVYNNLKVFHYTGSCRLDVYMVVTLCDDGNGNLNYFFEENRVVSVGTCPLDPPSLLEIAYELFIADYMANEAYDNLTPCTVGSTTVNSKQIKINCVSLCEVNGLNGKEWAWVKCSDEEACCIETREWCLDNAGNPVATEQEPTTIGGACEFNVGPCYYEPGPGGEYPSWAGGACIIRDCD